LGTGFRFDDRSIKRECVWQHRFVNLDHVIRIAGPWIDHYNNRRPHSSLGYLSPAAWRERDQARITSLSLVLVGSLHSGENCAGHKFDSFDHLLNPFHRSRCRGYGRGRFISLESALRAASAA
jgi:hypothetical protein